MAEILLARLVGPSGFERPVVIKRILPHLSREQRFRNMFLDEARIVAAIRHPNVVSVHELGQEGGELFLVMEYLEGESASSLARRLVAHRKLLSFGLCAHLMAEVAAGLHAAHELRGLDGKSQGLVHRDVSPANVFVTYSGAVKVLDFGIAVAADRVSRTEVGQVKGKYAYMSPEQCVAGPLDRRSDIFSMGTVLYELSTCRRLFKRESDMLTLQAICHGGVPRPRDLIPEYPLELEDICLRALAKRPEDRYPTALEMRRDLLEVARNLNGSKVPEESLTKVMRRLFEDRIGEKRQMLSRLRAGQVPGRLPAADIDDGVELEPVADGPSAGASGAEPPGLYGAPGSRPAYLLSGTTPGALLVDEPSFSVVVAPFRPGWPRWYRVSAAAAGALFLAGLLFMLSSSREQAVPDAPAKQASSKDGLNPPLETPEPERSVPERVELTITSEPPGAEVTFEGVLQGTTPLQLEVDPSSEPATLELFLASHVPVEEVVIPDRHQLLRVILVEVPKADAGSARAGASSSRATSARSSPSLRSRSRAGERAEPAQPYSRFN